MRAGPDRSAPASEAKRRILETADRLFYREGIRSVGIDRIIAEASVAKMTLYAHFKSKDDLILEVLRRRDGHVVDFFRAAMERQRGKSPLIAFFLALEEWFDAPQFRGCVFINTTIELAEREHACVAFAREQKARFNAMLRGIVRETLGKDDAPTAAAIALLVEGAIVTAQIQGTSAAARVARDAALRLVGRTNAK